MLAAIDLLTGEAIPLVSETHKSSDFMSLQMLDGIRVSSKVMLKERIYKYFDEVNAVPVPYKWKYKMDTIHLEDEDVSEIVYEVVNAKAASLQNRGKLVPIPTKGKGTKENQDK